MKAFIPYHIAAGEIVFEPTQDVSEPQGAQWRTFGVRKPDTAFPDESYLVHDDNDSQFVDVVIVVLIYIKVSFFVLFLFYFFLI